MTDGKTPAKHAVSVKILDENDNVSLFTCGVKEIDEFIHTEALDFQRESLGVTYLFLQHKEILGFATLSMADLKRERMEAKDRPEAAIENYPSLLMGQLAVCKKLQNQDLGTYICDFCVDRAMKFSKRVGCRFVFVSAIKPIGFYRKYGFILLPKQEGRHQKVMFLDILRTAKAQ
ncbi:MAG: GNAT family N-acetyltransferase [Candidatus Bathyarchaeia archaeon]